MKNIEKEHLIKEANEFCTLKNPIVLEKDPKMKKVNNKLNSLIQISIFLIIIAITLFILFLSVEFKVIDKMLHETKKEKSINIDFMIKPNTVEQEFRFLELENGFKGILISDPKSTKAAAAVMIPAGGNDDPSDYGGLAHLLEHYLHMGTKRHPSEKTYKSKLSSNGGSFNAFTSNMRTAYYFHVNNNALEELLDIFSGFFEEPEFKAEVIEREANAVHSEHQKNLISDSWRFHQLLRNLAYKDHPFNRFMTGNLETLVHKRGNDDLATIAKRFYREHYIAEKMTYTIVGNYSLDALEAMAKKHFANVNTKEKSYLAESKESTAAFNSEIKSGNKALFKEISTIMIPNRIPRFLQVFTNSTKSQSSSKTIFSTTKAISKPFMERLYGKRVTYESTEGVNSISIIIPYGNWPENIFKFKDFFRFLTFYLSYSGKNSLLSVLKKQGYMNDIDVDFESTSPDSILFVLRLIISEEGVKNIDEIEKILYSYLDMIYKDLEESQYDEQALIALIAFKYNYEANVIRLAIDFCEKANTNPFNYLNGSIPLHSLDQFFGKDGISLSPNQTYTIIGLANLKINPESEVEDLPKFRFKEVEKLNSQNISEKQSILEFEQESLFLETGDILKYAFHINPKKIIKSSLSLDNLLNEELFEAGGVQNAFIDEDLGDIANSLYTDLQEEDFYNQRTKTQKNLKKNPKNSQILILSDKEAEQENTTKPSRVYNVKEYSFSYKIEFRDNLEINKLVNPAILDSNGINLPRKNRFIPNDFSIAFGSECRNSEEKENKTEANQTQNSTKNETKSALAKKSNKFSIPVEYSLLLEEYVSKLLKFILSFDFIDTENKCIANLLEKDENSFEPVVFKNASGITIYLQSARNFRIPKIVAFIVIGNKKVKSSIKNELLAKIDLQIKEEIINEKFADALVLNHVSIGLFDQQYFFKLEVFSEKFQDLSEEIIEIFTSVYKTNKQQFLNTKANLIEKFEKFKYWQPYAKAYSYLDYFMLDDYVLPEEYLKVLDELKFTDYYEDLNKIFSKASYIKGLLYGNAIKNDANGFFNILSDKFPDVKNHSNFSKLETNSVLMKAQRSFVFRYKNTNEKDVNNALLNLYQFGQLNEKERIICEYLSSVLFSIAFDHIRTKKQLGYIVKSSYWKKGDNHGIILMSQGSFQSPHIINQEAEVSIQLLKEFCQNVNQTTLDNFFETKSQSRKVNEFKQKGDTIWSKIHKFDYINEFPKIEKSDLVTFYENYFVKNARKLSIQVFNPNKLEDWDLLLDANAEVSGIKAKIIHTPDDVIQ